jgi:ABC-type phosphate transport system auxiliary subunit
LDYLLLNMRSPPSTTAEMATTAVGLPQTTTPDERRLELELKLAEAATAKIVAETAKIEAECKLLQLQNSRKRCRDEELVEVDLRSEFSPDKI